MQLRATVLVLLFSLPVALGLRSAPNGWFGEGGLFHSAYKAARDLLPAAESYSQVKQAIKPHWDNTVQSVSKIPQDVRRGLGFQRMSDLPAGFATKDDIPRAVLNGEQLANLEKDDSIIQCPYTCDPSFCSNEPEGDTHCYKPSGQNEKICEKFSDEEKSECPAGYSWCGASFLYNQSRYSLSVATNHSMTVYGWNLQRCLQLFAVPSDESCDTENGKLLNGIVDETSMVGNFPRVYGLPGGHQFAISEGVRFKEVGIFKACVASFRLDKLGKRIYLDGMSVGMLDTHLPSAERRALAGSRE